MTSTTETRFKEKFCGVEGHDTVKTFLNPRDADILSFIESEKKLVIEEIVKEAERMKKEIHEEDSEKFGYDLLEKIGSCCPGDDAANVYEYALDSLISKLKTSQEGIRE